MKNLIFKRVVTRPSIKGNLVHFAVFLESMAFHFSVQLQVSSIALVIKKVLQNPIGNDQSLLSFL